ncbi:MAG TPA: phosphotransferase family protein [Actinomycetota bacterium]
MESPEQAAGEALARFVGDALPGEGPFRLERLTTGASNWMYLMRRDGGAWVLRRPPDRRTDRRYIAREFRMLRALAATEVPVPTPLLLCEDPDVIGAPFHVMEHVKGFTPMDPLPAGVDRATLARSLVDGLAAIARVDWRAAGLEGFGKPDGFLERQVGRWLGQLETYRAREIPGIDELARRLDASVPPAAEPGILHGDYQFINVLARADGTLAAVLDWEQSTIGDPLLDLGWLLAGWSEPGEEPLRFGSRYLKDRTGFPSRADLAERYATATGRSLERLAFYEALALFKLACVLEGSYAAFVSGASTNPMHEKMGALVVEAVAQAHQVIAGSHSEG